jgi:hypothetical protein
MSAFYAAMSDLEIVGHVNAIPDASELSQALAARVRALTTERDRLARELTKARQQTLSLELGVALDKVAAYEDITSSGG